MRWISAGPVQIGCGEDRRFHAVLKHGHNRRIVDAEFPANTPLRCNTVLKDCSRRLNSCTVDKGTKVQGCRNVKAIVFKHATCKFHTR